jgi:Uma2 family endonuclease
VERELTADELLAWPEDPDFPWRYELVEGRLVRMVPPGFEHGELTQDLSSEMHVFSKRRKLDIVTAAETGFRLALPGSGDTVLAPDIAFTSTARLAGQPAKGSAGRRRHLRVAPDLAVEIASPDQHRPEMAEKARRYLAAGVRLVWIVWPGVREVDVWRVGADQPVATLTIGDTLDGEDVLPGFRYRVAELFG